MMHVRWSLSTAMGGKRKLSSVDYTPPDCKRPAASPVGAPIGTPLLASPSAGGSKKLEPSSSSAKNKQLAKSGVAKKKREAPTSSLPAFTAPAPNPLDLNTEDGLDLLKLLDDAADDHTSLFSAPAPAAAERACGHFDEIDSAFNSFDATDWFELDHVGHDSLDAQLISSHFDDIVPDCDDTELHAAFIDAYTLDSSEPSPSTSARSSPPTPKCAQSTPKRRKLVWQNTKVISASPAAPRAKTPSLNSPLSPATQPDSPPATPPMAA